MKVGYPCILFMESVLIVPGYGNSGPDHWQSHWQACLPNATRADLGDWDHPDEAQWTARLSSELDRVNGKTVLVAHSLGCLLVVNCLSSIRSNKVAGAFLVAPPDPRRDAFPQQIRGFRDLKADRLSIPSIIISSTNDPYSSPTFGAYCAKLWGSRHVSIGTAGHINADSGYGHWVAGLEMLGGFVTYLKTQKGPID